MNFIMQGKAFYLLKKNVKLLALGYRTSIADDNIWAIKYARDISHTP